MLPQNREAVEKISTVIDIAIRARLPYRLMLRRFRKEFITAELEFNNWNQCRTARELGMHRNTLDRQMRELGISRETPRKPLQAAVNFYSEQERAG